MIERCALTNEHQAIAHVATTLLTLAIQRDSDVIQMVKLRWRLAHMLAGHLAKEDKIIYPQLKAHPDARVARLADRYAHEMGNLSEQYRGYMNAWTAESIAANRDGFERQTRRVIALLERRIEKEESELYPLCERSSAAPPVNSRAIQPAATSGRHAI